MTNVESLSEDAVIGQGEYGTVFAIENDRVVKLFRAEGSSGWQDGLVRLHTEEVLAYERAHADSRIARYVPRSYGGVSVGRVIDAAGHDVSDGYLLPLGLMLERLHGEAVELTQLSQRPPEIHKIIELFAQCGIYADDGSVFGVTSPETCKFIDITTNIGNRLAAELIVRHAAGQDELERFILGE